MSARNDTILIRPEYSAVAAKNRRRPSRGTQAAIAVLREKRASRVCEIGCGLLANSWHLVKAFKYVVLTDRKEQYERIREQLDELRRFASFKAFIEARLFARQKLNLDAAIIINVLHILPSRQERLDVLNAARRNLRKGGALFIDGPYNETYYRDLVKTAVSYRDGVVMRRGDYCTFYRNMDFGELRSYVEEAGFTFERRIFLDHRTSFVAERA